MDVAGQAREHHRPGLVAQAAQQLVYRADRVFGDHAGLQVGGGARPERPGPPGAVGVGAEALTRLVDFTDRGTCVLFGDGAGAMVLEANDSGDGRGFLGFVMYTDGAHWDKLYVPGGGCKSRPYFTPEMFESLGTIPIVEGRQVFRLASQLMPEAVRDVLAKTGHRLEDVDLLLMHQANQNLLVRVAGFTQYWVELGKPIQDELISRTEYEQV